MLSTGPREFQNSNHLIQDIRILNAEPLNYCNEARAILSHLGEVVEAPLGRTELLAQLPSYDVLIVRVAHQVDRDVIEAGTRLRAIVTATTGLDHIDVDYATSKGITVLSLRGETEFLATVSATAEHTWALLLTLVRRIPEALQDVKDGGWRRDAFRGQELCGKRLGIVGLGRIGRKVAGYGLSFGMKVVAYDPYTTQWLAGVEQAQTLEALLRQSEVLSLHVPLTKETARMISWEALCHLPEQAILINTSRGEIVDEDALCKALECGRMGGAGLDVACNERADELRRNSALVNYASRAPNLLITPHIGGATSQSMKRTEIFMAHKLASFLKALPAL